MSLGEGKRGPCAQIVKGGGGISFFYLVAVDFGLERMATRRKLFLFALKLCRKSTTTYESKPDNLFFVDVREDPSFSFCFPTPHRLTTDWLR